MLASHMFLLKRRCHGGQVAVSQICQDTFPPTFDGDARCTTHAGALRMCTRGRCRLFHTSVCKCWGLDIATRTCARPRSTESPRRCASSPWSRGQSRYCNKDNPTQIQQGECAIISKVSSSHGSPRREPFMNQTRCTTNYAVATERPPEKDNGENVINKRRQVSGANGETNVRSHKCRRLVVRK